METPRRHLLVDGHNVLHALGWMSDGESVARSRLIDAMRMVHDVEGVQITVVFDSPGAISTNDPVAATEHFHVTYAAAGMTADGVIERLATAAPDPRQCVVITGDTQVRGNVLAAGGECVPPDELPAWIERCRARAQRAIRSRRAAQRDSFGNKLPL